MKKPSADFPEQSDASSSAASTGKSTGTSLPTVSPSTEPCEASVNSHAGKSLHLLVVDDDPSMCELFAIFLDVDGHTCVCAGNGREGIAAFRAGHFDIVLTDRVMPIMDGEQFALAVQELRPGQPVIMVTGSRDLFNDAGMLPPGVTILLYKPLSQQELRHALASALANEA